MGRLDRVDQVRSHEKNLIQMIWIYLSCVERKNIKSKTIESKKLLYTLKGNRYITEPVPRLRTFKVFTDIQNLKSISKTLFEYFLGFVHPHETLKVLPLGTGSIIYLSFLEFMSSSSIVIYPFRVSVPDIFTPNISTYFLCLSFDIFIFQQSWIKIQ